MFWSFLNENDNYSIFLKNSMFFFVLSLSKVLFFIHKVCFSLRNIITDFFIFQSIKKKNNIFFNIKLFNTSLSFLTFYSNFRFKKRLRISGLGYGLELLPELNSFKLMLGFSKVVILNIPSFLCYIRTNKKKKKISFIGIRSSSVNFFSSKLKNLRFCDVYKHKGVRFRFERVPLKEGKRGLRH